MCAWVHVCVQQTCRSLWRSEKDVGSPGIRVIGNYEHHIATASDPGSFARAAGAVDHRSSPVAAITFFYKFIYLLLLCAWVFFLHIWYVCVSCAYLPTVHGARRVSQFLRLELISGCELLYGCWKSNLGLQEEQPVFLIDESSLQSLSHCFKH